jgi:type IV secretory pathway ATPase VirB11/archaellum biosynthesis ATPase
LINKIDRNKRIITVEDTRELAVPGLNRVHVVMSRTGQANNMTYGLVRDLIVRMTPDIVMAGEISNFNAATIWELMTTGHGHFMTTIHANSAEEAITTFISCISNARAAAGNSDAIDREELREAMREKLRIIQMKKDDIKGRYISNIF